jgi:hypothetical protein
MSRKVGPFKLEALVNVIIPLIVVVVGLLVAFAWRLLH